MSNSQTAWQISIKVPSSFPSTSVKYPSWGGMYFNWFMSARHRGKRGSNLLYFDAHVSFASNVMRDYDQVYETGKWGYWKH